MVTTIYTDRMKYIQYILYIIKAKWQCYSSEVVMCVISESKNGSVKKRCRAKWQEWSRLKKGQYHCVKSVRIRSYSGPHFSCIFPHSDWIWRDTECLSVFSPNAGKCGKNADQNNSEYGRFLRSERYLLQEAESDRTQRCI